jgi:UDP-glucose/iron transport system permease protein
MNSFIPDWTNIATGSLVLLLPIILFLRAKLGLVKTLLVSFVRMGIQLFLVGIYLKYLIEWNILWINILFLIFIIMAGAHTVGSRSDLKLKFIFPPIAIGFFSGYLLSSFFFIFAFFAGGDFLDARYLIPISGMLIGNSLTSAVVGIRSFFKNMIDNKESRNYLIANGASVKVATNESFTLSIKDAFMPMIANISAIGLIWLPGTMTGQIIAGQDPSDAIKYQIMIVVGYFTCCVITVFVSLWLARRSAFDGFDQLREDVYKI